MKSIEKIKNNLDEDGFAFLPGILSNSKSLRKVTSDIKKIVMLRARNIGKENLFKEDKDLNFIEKFNLKLVHIHANNWSTCGLNNIPSSIEFSFSKKPILLKNDLNFPHELDQNNNPNNDEIKLVFSDQ